MIKDVQTAIPLGFFLAFMIGPVFFTLLQTSVVKGFGAAVAFDLGVVFSDLLYILLAYFSSYQLLENLSNQPGFYVFGGTLLGIYGVIIFLVGVNYSNRSKFRRRTKTLFVFFTTLLVVYFITVVL